MHIAVVGAGAIGGYLAARLNATGADQVTLVVRPDQLPRLAQIGLEVRLGARNYRLTRVVDALLEPADVVLLAVKTQDLAQACQGLRPTIGAATVVTLQNGIRADRVAAENLGADRIIGGVTVCAATCLQPGFVSVDVPGWLVVGAPFPLAAGRLAGTAKLLSRALPTYVTANLRGARWMKLISNLNNGLSAATGLSWRDLARKRCGRKLSYLLMCEGYRVAMANNVHLDHQTYGFGLAALYGMLSNALPRMPEAIANAVLWSVGAVAGRRLNVRGSTWQSLVRGTSSEIDYLNGEVVRLGQKLRIPTPCNEAVVEAVRAIEVGHAFWSAEELWSSVA